MLLLLLLLLTALLLHLLLLRLLCAPDLCGERDTQWQRGVPERGEPVQVGTLWQVCVSC